MAETAVAHAAAIAQPIKASRETRLARRIRRIACTAFSTRTLRGQAFRG